MIVQDNLLSAKLWRAAVVSWYRKVMYKFRQVWKGFGQRCESHSSPSELWRLWIHVGSSRVLPMMIYVQLGFAFTSLIFEDVLPIDC